ncbi:MAG: amidohydrolase [Saprospiraceae bacterium]|jgi:amidohydrolase
MNQIFKLVFLSILVYSCSTIKPLAQGDQLSMVEMKAAAVNAEVIALRHHFHQYPELSNREFKTAERIAKELDKLGLPYETGVAITGVVAVLDSGKPGPTIALRADIDGLPVTERAPIPFASKERTTYLGEDIGIMHACGHDTHIAMLLGTAKILVGMKDQLKGKVVFVFQPAEEGAPVGEEGGAALMIKEGIIEKYGIDVFFGQHISSTTPVGHINYKLGGIMAAADPYTITVKGKQSHGSRPWAGIDPITVSAQIIQGLNNIVSRQMDLTKEAAVITVGKIKGGFRGNIIPEEVEMIGTIRTLDTDMQKDLHERMHRTVKLIAESAGATAILDIQPGYPITFNHLDLTRKMLPSLYKAAGEDNVHVIPAVTGAEDFSFFANEVPGLYFFTGGKPLGSTTPAPHHTPDFFIDDSSMVTGVKAMTMLTLDYMNGDFELE